jgi:nitroreductase
MSTNDAGFDLAMTDRLLTTTKSVRLRLDLARDVEQPVLEECMSIALQAATGAAVERWRWVIVRDPEKRKRFGEIYLEATMAMIDSAPAAEDASEGTADKLSSDLAAQMTPAMQRLMASGGHLVQHMAEVPAIVIACVVGRPEGSPSWTASQYGSVFPAVWNLQLALRSRGLGSCITASHLEREQEVAELLSIPYDSVMQVCALPVAYYTGDSFKRAPRRPLSEVVFTDAFDASSLEESGW